MKSQLFGRALFALVSLSIAHIPAISLAAGVGKIKVKRAGAYAVSVEVIPSSVAPVTGTPRMESGRAAGDSFCDVFVEFPIGLARVTITGRNGTQTIEQPFSFTLSSQRLSASCADENEVLNSKNGTVTWQIYEFPLAVQAAGYDSLLLNVIPFVNSRLENAPVKVENGVASVVPQEIIDQTFRDLPDGHFTTEGVSGAQKVPFQNGQFELK